MRPLHSLHRPGLPSAFAPAARPLALATLLTLSLALATGLFTARTLQSAQGVTARALTVTAADLDLLHELRADSLRGVATAWRLALARDPAQHGADAEALQARVAQLDRAIAGQRNQVDEQGRAALHALATVRTQLIALAGLCMATLVLAGLWRARTQEATAEKTTPPPFPAGALDAAIHAARRAAARQAVQTRMLSRSSSRRTTS